MEKFDFSKIEEQQQFEKLPEVEKQEIIEHSQEESEEIQKNIEAGRAENYKEAALLFDLEKSVFDKSEAASERVVIAKNITKDSEGLPYFTGQSGHGSDALTFLLNGYEEALDALGGINYYKNFIDDVSKIINKNLPVIDLGCGPRYGREMADFCARLGVQGYMGVDKYSVDWGSRGCDKYEKSNGAVFNYSERPSDNEWKKDEDSKWLERNDFVAALYSEDMLEFLAKVKDKTTNIFLNGIDTIVIREDEYWDRLISEIDRVIPVGGIFWFNGYDCEYIFEKYELEKKFQPLGQEKMFIKIKE